MLEAINRKKQIRLLIEHDQNVGYYLYVYPLNSNKTIADYLCDDLEEAFAKAEEIYEVKRSEFKTYASK
jgi:hypothetical protein